MNESTATIAAMPGRDGMPPWRSACMPAPTSSSTIGRSLDFRLLEKAFRMAETAIVITDFDLNIVAANAAFSDLSGYTSAELLGMPLPVSMPGNPVSSLLGGQPQETGQAARHGGGPDHGHGVQGEVRYRHRGGQVRTVWMTLSTLGDGRGGVQGHVATFTDISPIDRERQALRHMAHHDLVTGLPNRRFLTSELKRCMARARRHGLRLAVLFVDLDRFKWVNDTLGHEVGDTMLREMGRRLRAAVRTEDLVARWGGDEFVVVMEDVGQAANAAGVAALILAEIGLGLRVGGQHVPASASIGVALFPDDAESVEELVAVADASMYRAKKAGGARVDAWHAC